MPERVQQNVIIELAPSAPDLASATAATSLGKGKAAPSLDPDFEPVQLPALELIDPA